MTTSDGPRETRDKSIGVSESSNRGMPLVCSRRKRKLDNFKSMPPNQLQARVKYRKGPHTGMNNATFLVKKVQAEQDIFDDPSAHRYRKLVQERPSSELFDRHSKDFENEADVSTKRAVEGETVEHANNVLLFSRFPRLADFLEKITFSLGVLSRIRRVGSSDFED